MVPILVGAINKDKEEEYGKLLAPYLAREDTFFVVSSDFCHWYGHLWTTPRRKLTSFEGANDSSIRSTTRHRLHLPSPQFV